MKRWARVLVTACVVVAAGAAGADDGLYRLRPEVAFSGVGVRLGVVDPEWVDTGFLFGGHIGLGSLLHHRLRLTGEVQAWSAGDLEDKTGAAIGGDLTDFSLGGNLGLDLFEVRRFAPYVLAGLSAHWIGADIPADRELEDALDGLELGLDLGTGVAWRAPSGWRVGAESRWVLASDVGSWSLTGSVGWWPHREPKRELYAPAAVAASPTVVTVPAAAGAGEIALLQGMVRDLLEENRELQAELARVQSALARGRSARDAQARATASELEAQRAELRAALEEVAGLSGQVDALRETQDGLLLSMKASLLFPIGGHRLQVGALEELRRIGSVLQRYPDVTIVVEGHTDSMGDAAFNQQLSEKRAAAVRRELLRLGVAEDSIQSIGFGADHPVADNATSDGRARNRRVEIRLRQPGIAP